MAFNPTLSKEENIKYFRLLVADETDYEENLAKEWEDKLAKNGPESHNPAITEEGADQIRLAIGQSRLFLRKKLQQFVGLIDECEEGNTSTTPTDLAGFWEMIYMQVKNIHDRFDHLEVLAANGWKTPVKVKEGPKKVSNGTQRPKSSVAQPSSKLREAIKQARTEKENAAQ